MTSKISKSIIFISTVAVLLTIILTTVLLNEYSTKQSFIGLSQQAMVIGKSVETNGMNYLESTDFGDTFRVTWISADGTVIFDSVADEKSLDNHADRKEIHDALENGSGNSMRYSGTLMQSALNCAERLSDGTVLRVSTVHLSILAHMMNMTGPLVLVIVGISLLSVLVSDKVSKKIVQPINSINPDRPLISKTYKELEPLLNKLNTQNSRVRRQMEELTENRMQFEQIVANISEGIILTDPKLNIITLNEGSEKLLCVDNIQVGQSVYTLNSSDEFRKCILDALGGMRSECMLRTKNGEREIIASPARRIDMVCGLVIFVLDVTEKYRLEEMRREFTANVSHELKTPLTTIYGISDMLMGNMVMAEDVAQFGADIHYEAERLISLINDTISLSKLDEGIRTDNTAEIDVYELTSEILERLELSAEEKEISTSVSGEHIIVNADRLILNDIIYNLCDNGIKYNKQGGKLNVNISANRKNAVITVSDTGKGIPEEHIGRIFERFYRVDKSRSDKVKGTGLGLSIVKHSVMQTGGTVDVKSETDKGTVFTVEIPIQKA